MIMDRIQESKAGFMSLAEAIDTTTAPGRMLMQLVGAFAEFERAILRGKNQGWIGCCP
jgi:DNA invertase Pin-like site-specific DNA recombinase